MKRSVKIFILGLVVIGLMAGSAFAGNVTLSNGRALTVSKEYVEGNTVANPLIVNVGDKIVNYIPTQIPLGSLTDPVVNVSVDAGKLFVAAGVTPELCVSVPGGPAIAVYETGSGTNELIFQPNVGQAATNNTSYLLGKGGCASALVATDITLSVPPQTLVINGTIKLGTGQTQIVFDTAAASLAEIKEEFSALVTTKADAQIDPAAAFKLFLNGADTDTITVTTSQAVLDVPAPLVAGSDETTLKFQISDVSGLTAGSVAIPGWICDMDLTTKIATCTISQVAVGPQTATFTVDGTSVLAERTFTATAEIDFFTATVKDRTAANNWPLLLNADAGKWTYFGVTVHIPLIKVGPGMETFIKLQSSDKTEGANGVNAAVLASDGNLVPVSIGKIVAGTPLVITGTDLMGMVEDEGGEVNGTAGFAAKITVFTSEPNLFAYANTCDSTGCKRIPVKTSGGLIVE